MKITELKPGQMAKIVRISSQGSLKKRLVDMGIMVGESIEFKRNAPLGDPMHYVVKKTGVAIRSCDAKSIDVELLGDKK